MYVHTYSDPSCIIHNISRSLSTFYSQSCEINRRISDNVTDADIPNPNTLADILCGVMFMSVFDIHLLVV